MIDLSSLKITHRLTNAFLYGLSEQLNHASGLTYMIDAFVTHFFNAHTSLFLNIPFGIERHKHFSQITSKD